VRTRPGTGHPVLKGLLILIALGLVIRLLPYLLAAALLAGLIWGAQKLHRSSRRKADARTEREASIWHNHQLAEQQEQQEQQRAQTFLLPEDKEWLHR